MDRRRAAGLLLALAACIATATAAPTASNHTALDLYDGAPDGCYYNFQHYGEGDRIMTNEPCLNCTCHNRMLMCYLRVCPFTKPIGQDCTIEKRADQCCPIVTCPDVPVDLLTSTTTSPAEYGSTGIGKLDKFGCSINGKYFSEGSKVPPTPNKPCEHCYCIRNMTTCVMQECTLHVDGCTPIYHKDVCCPVRYSCDHPEDEMPLLDDLSTTVRPTQGFLLTTTTISPVTQISQDCVYDNRVFSDGALIKTEKACDHCYCMKGDIVCVVQECGTPMENEGKNCTALLPREGVCCPDTYICEGDESTTETIETDFTTHAAQEKLTSLSPPRRTSSEGSGYRNEPDEIPYTEMPIFEPEIEGSGEEEQSKQPAEITTGSPTLGLTDDILASTEETHEYIPFTTTKPTEEEKTIASIGKEVEKMPSSGDMEKSSEPQPSLPSTTGDYSIKEAEEPVTDKIQAEDMSSGKLPDDIGLKPHEEIPVTPSGSDRENVVTTETNEQNITSEITERESSESQIPTTTAPIEEEKSEKPIEQHFVTIGSGEKTTLTLPIERDGTSAAPTPALEESTKTPELTELNNIQEESATKVAETSSFATTSPSVIEKEVKETTESAEKNIISSVSDEFNKETSMEPQYYPSSSSSLRPDDEFVTTESQEHEQVTESVKETEYFGPQQHITASTPMLEEIEKDTTEYTEPERIVPGGVTQDETFNILSTTIPNDLSVVSDEKDLIKSTVAEEHVSEDYVPDTTITPEFDQYEKTTEEPQNIPEISIETDGKHEPGQYSSLTTPSTLIDSGRRTTQSDVTITISEEDSKHHGFSSSTSTTVSALESEEVTTEPDKGLNTIPSDLVEEEISVSSDVQKTTVAEENITTESDLDIRFNPSTDFNIIPSKLTTTSDTSASREEPSPLTTESTFKKENYSPVVEAGPKLTTVPPVVAEEVISTLTHDHTKGTESVLDLQHEIATTSEPKYTESIEETTLAKENIESATPETSVTEKDFGFDKEIITSTPPHEKISETTTANQEDNEILNEPRIPGEGDCLLNGVTYTNESALPSTNKCQSGCRCISSIIKCYPIICSPPPEYMDNCETMYDTPDACCPTYICDHKTETIPPQSHSQMSGTEAPVVSTVHCHGDECEISKDKEHQEKPSDACKSGNCAGPSDEPKESSSYVPSKNISEQPSTDKKEECAGDNCTPILCTDENGCQASAVKPCEGEKCETTPDVILPQHCVDDENCAVPNIPTKECSTGNCDIVNAQSEDTYPKEKPSDQYVPEQCKEPDCKQTQTGIEPSTVSILEQTSQKDTSEDDKTEIPVKITETTDKFETPIESFTEILEPHEVVTKQPEITSDEILTTFSDSIALVTKFVSETETTTKLSEPSYEQEVTNGDIEPENIKPELIEKQEYPSQVPTENTIKDYETTVSSDKLATEISGVSSTPKYSISTDEPVIKTEHPQEFVTSQTQPEINLQEVTSAETLEESNTEPAKTYTFEMQHATESVEKVEPENATPAFIEESSTESPTTYALESHETTKSLVEAVEISKESSTESSATQDGVKLPEIIEHADTTTTFVRESSTEPSTIYATESQKITGPTQAIGQEEITKKTTVESITEPPKYIDDIKQEESTNDISDSSGTEATKLYVTKDQAGKEDYTETILNEDIRTETPALPIDSQSVTVTPGDDSSTIKIAEDIGQESSTSSGSQDMTQTRDEVKPEDTPSILTEETSTKPSITVSTESFEITKTSEELEYKITTMKILEKSSTDLPIPYTIGPNDLTKSPQDLGHEDTTHEVTDENVTLPPKTYSTDSHIDTQAPEKVEHKDTIITVTNTEPSQSYATEPIPPEEVYHDDSTSKISEETSSESPIIHTMEQEITKSPENIDHEDTTPVISEEPPKSYVTEPQETPAEVDQKDTTSKMSEESGTEPPKLYSTEQQEVTKSPEDIYVVTTMNILEESVTEPSKAFETEPQEVPKAPEVVDQEDTTSKTVPVTELYVTEPAQDVSKSTEESTDSTVKTITETVTKLSETENEIEHHPAVDSESPGQHVTESDIIETPKPTVIEIITEGPKEDEKMPFTGAEISEIITTPKELFISESAESTTPSFISDSKTTTPEVFKETTDKAPESQPPQTDIVRETEPTVKEQVTTMSVPVEHDISITVTPVTSNSEQLHVEATPEQQETQKPELEIQTTLSPTIGIEEISFPDLQETSSTQPEKVTTADVSEAIDTEIQVPDFGPADELRTTSSDLEMHTTPEPIKTSQAPHDMEIKTETSYVPLKEHSEEVSTEEILAGTEKPVVPEEIKTEKPAAMTEADYTKETEFETTPSQIVSDDKQEENYTEEPISKYSSPKPTAGYDSTKVYTDEGITDTVEPMFHESKEPEKPVDDLIQSLVTEQYEGSTKPSDLEKDSQTTTPVQVTSAIPESDLTQSSEHDIVKEKLTTLSSIIPDTTVSESDDKSVSSTEYAKPIEEKGHTEPPSIVDKIASEPTTQKEYLPEENAITQKPLVPEQNEIMTSTISEYEFTTRIPDIIPPIEVATETIASDKFLPEKQESSATYKPSVDLHEISTESSYTTEASNEKATTVDQSAIKDSDYTESGQEVTIIPDDQIQKQTEPSESVSVESPKIPIGTEAPTSESDNQDLISGDLITTENPDFSKKQPELTTLKPSVETESSAFEPTTTSKYEYLEITKGPSKDADHTDKTTEESAVTPTDKEFTTGSARVTESSNPPSSEAYTEKQPEITQTVAPEIETPIEEYFTTRKQIESEMYQTTLSTVEDFYKVSSPSPISPEDGSTTSVQDISPNNEQTSPTEEPSISVAISDTEKTSPPEESIVVQTERVIPASEKPLQESTAPEEEFMLATSKVTVAKAEETTLSPTTDRTIKPTEIPDEQPITTVFETPITAPSEAPITTEPQAPFIATSEAVTTAAPDVPITTTPEASLTAGPEAPITTAPEASITAAPDAPFTSAPEVPIKIAPEAPVASTEVPVPTEPETPITKTPEPPITNAPEQPITTASEPPITIASEPPVTTAPELPKPVSTEVQPTDEAPTPDEGSFPPTGGASGYGQEPDYVEEDQTFGPGTCRYGGKVYVSAQQIPRDDPCDFCFCFRSDIICLQQSCPPPIHGCHEEPIQGFCCPRYECPVSMATTVNVTTTTTTTTTTLPPHFPTHSYKGSVQKRGCQIKGQTYKVGEVVRASSGPCLHCTCGGDGQMKCDPKVCTPEPMLRQMIAAAVSAKRRR